MPELETGGCQVVIDLVLQSQVTGRCMAVRINRHAFIDFGQMDFQPQARKPFDIGCQTCGRYRFGLDADVLLQATPCIGTPRASMFFSGLYIASDFTLCRSSFTS